MNVKALFWLSVKTPQFDAVTHFYKEVMGIKPFLEDTMSSRFTLENGTKVHVYRQGDTDHDFFGGGPVIGFLVDEVEQAEEKMEAAGIEFTGPVQHSETHNWNHFGGPDGNIYEIMDEKS